MNKNIHILEKGGVLALPTDMVYGLCADATNFKAVAKVFAIKGRKEEKALPIFVSHIKMAKTIAVISPKQEVFLAKVWPGKVTVVLNVKPNSPLASNAISKDNTVALRIPSHPIVLDILNHYKKPLTGTSANRSGEPSCLDAECVKNQLTFVLPDAIVDGGKLPQSEPSTIIDLTKTPPKIIRQGAGDKKVMEQINNLLHSGN